MDTLLTIDLADYDPSWPRFRRPSVRAIIHRGCLIAAVYSAKYDYYKFPGGGIEPGESCEQALVREVREETGLMLISSSVNYFGSVLRIQADSFGDALIFEQENLYYFANADEGSETQQLDDYEAEEGFTLQWITVEQLIDVNRTHSHGSADPVMIEREARLASLLINSQN